MSKLRKGTAATRDFYDRVGWRRQDGTLVDTRLFGWTDGPIRNALDAPRRERVRQVAGGPGLRLAELGCGGTPAVFPMYSAADFSSAGLSEAAAALKETNVPFETIETDITDCVRRCLLSPRHLPHRYGRWSGRRVSGGHAEAFRRSADSTRGSQRWSKD